MIDRQKCRACGACVDACSENALKIYGQAMTAEAVFDEIRRDADFYTKSGGGVTASGGECLMQADFTAELFHLCHRVGFHTTIDTCGYASEGDLEKVLAQTDLVLFDLKVMNSDEHKRLTKQSNEIIFRNAQLVVRKSLPIIFRTPIIPGITDSEENLDAIARFVAGLDCLKRVDILPYHRLGEGKYKILGRTYELIHVTAPGGEQMQRALETFKQYGIECEIQE